ncbi:uncharacterized protein HRG_08535 [Hirsutella rhossiliensis]|uniref:HTH psq-type domain-containing protein n=1 Tax=Hirsutella rhossiliensis TaxID=111463 RepID=A0A9P8SGE2_9HYPO|nr:uncharacterized protein HRG_08535 [Hirsutella rhossiliensis]KAH0960380.1 hypothetical protein HRG_08535 [Hirsutella rhossiliensis]
MDHNTRIAEAIIELQSQDRPKYAETARRYNIDKSTLWRRFKGKTASNHDANSYSRQKLTSAQEEILIGHVNKLTDRGIPPTPQMLKNIAEDLDHQRKIEKYNISPSNVYNFDEKGFQIGLSRSTKRVVPREALRRGKLVGASQDGNREFITLIAAICADYSYLPPALIYKGESKDFQDTWLEDFDHSSERSPEHQRNWRHNMSSYNTKIEIYRKRSNLHIKKGNAERWNWRGDVRRTRHRPTSSASKPLKIVDSSVLERRQSVLRSARQSELRNGRPQQN